MLVAGKSGTGSNTPDRIRNDSDFAFKHSDIYIAVLLSYTKGAMFAPCAVDRPCEGGGRFTPHPGDIARVSGN